MNLLARDNLYKDGVYHTVDNMVRGDSYILKNPVGEDVRVAETEEGVGTATFSSCGSYRYRLSRIWDKKLKRVNFIMLNPSKASELILDPTVKRCVRFAKYWGFGSIEVTNIFPLISTDPKLLYTPSNIVDDKSNRALIESSANADKVICAWGAHGIIKNRGHEVKYLLKNSKITCYCFKTLKDGEPIHPLYLPYSQKVIKFI
jgi:hypothetical protein